MTGCRQCSTYSGLRAIVTGLPRSGTSFTAGLIARLGLSPGPRWLLRRGNAHNPYGYYENVILNRLTGGILSAMGRDFDLNLPRSRAEFEALDLGRKRRVIQLIMRLGRIDVYKDNKLVLYPELYAGIFPKARFIFVARNADARFASRFGKAVSREAWEAFNAKRLALWKASPVSGQALNIRYEDFFHDLDGMIDTIGGYLRLELGEAERRAARDFFRPRRTP